MCCVCYIQTRIILQSPLDHHISYSLISNFSIYFAACFLKIDNLIINALVRGGECTQKIRWTKRLANLYDWITLLCCQWRAFIYHVAIRLFLGRRLHCRLICCVMHVDSFCVEPLSSIYRQDHHIVGYTYTIYYLRDNDRNVCSPFFSLISIEDEMTLVFPRRTWVSVLLYLWDYRQK